MPLVITESRRQTGAGRLLDTPGAALEVAVAPADAPAFEAAWRRAARALCTAVGWHDARLAARSFGGGLSLAVAAPVDGLYAAVALNEDACALARANLSGDDPDATSFDAAVARVRAVIDRDRDDRLVALVAAAAAHGVACLWDDEALTLGLGAGSTTWPADALPEPADVPWDAIHDVPVALVTGTNGKSTTVRMIAAMATAAGHTPGVSTTDYVAVGADVIETGDFSGPMGARAALRDRRATAGILEVARGGLLRRGVPVPRVAVACVTNVAADHLGEFGVETVEALAEVKFVVAKALVPGGHLVVNADDALSMAEVDRQAPWDAALCGTGLDPDAPFLAATELSASVVDGQFALRRLRKDINPWQAGAWTALLPVSEAPSALGGTALHNVRNALTAVAAAAALGLPDAAIVAGLRAFRGDARDNPGRGNHSLVRGATVVVDYAHNAHGTAALVDYARTLPAARRLVLVSCAGDRSDADVRALAAAARAFCADRTLAADLPGYLRGRAPGETPALLVAESLALGAPPGSAEAFEDPPAAARAALAWARPGDVLLLFVLSHRDEVAALVQEAVGSGQ